MKYENLSTHIESDNVLVITIDRPEKLNALNQKTINEIGEAIQEVYDNKDIKAAIITGAGDKAFVAGADIAEFADFSPAQASEMATNGHRILNKIEACPKPVVAAVNGFALGGGCELAMACHLRVASENARFGQPEVSLGIMPGYGGTQRLPHLVGKGRALEILISGVPIKAQEALDIGLVNRIAAPEELMNECLSLLSNILDKGPIAVGRVIRAVNAVYAASEDGFQVEIQEFGSCFETQDFKEGTAAFIEKRQAKFEGA